jgi:hypothetical protein
LSLREVAIAIKKWRVVFLDGSLFYVLMPSNRLQHADCGKRMALQAF